jgi:hypothetical protein
MTQRSSGPAVIGPGRRLCARASDHSVTPASAMAWRGAATNVRHLEVGGLLQVVRVGGDKDVLLGPLAEQRLHLRMEFLRDERHGGAAVLDVVAQLVGQVHRVHRHHHRVGAQDGVVADDVLRAVLHEEQHAVALLHAGFPLQPAGEALGLVAEFGEADRRVVEDQVGLVGIARRRDLGVVEQRGRRHAHAARLALGPEGEVPAGHYFSSR